MPTRPTQLVLDTADPGATARWWAEVLGWAVTEWSPEEWEIFPAGFTAGDGSAVPLLMGLNHDAKVGLNRLHLDLRGPAGDARDAELVRLLGLGAEPADIGQGDVPWTVLTSPDGDEFCLLEHREMYADTGPVAAIVAKARDPLTLAGFWAEATGWRIVRHGDGYAGLRDPRGVGPFLEFVRDDSAKVVKNRWHLDIAPYPDGDRRAEVERLTTMGAHPIELGRSPAPDNETDRSPAPDNETDRSPAPDNETAWTVMADPEGNEFCVLTPR